MNTRFCFHRGYKKLEEIQKIGQGFSWGSRSALPQCLHDVPNLCLVISLRQIPKLTQSRPLPISPPPPPPKGPYQIAHPRTPPSNRETKETKKNKSTNSEANPGS